MAKNAFEKFGDFLKYKRSTLGISQADLASKTGIDRTYLSMLENRGNPAFNKIQEICKALNISVEDFFKTAPKEAGIPLVSVEFPDVPKHKKLAEQMITNFTFPVPILNSAIPLYSKVVEDDNIDGYILFDRSLHKADDKQKLIVWIPKTSPAIQYCLVDINECTIQHSNVYLLELQGEIVVKKVIEANDGYVLINPLDPHCTTDVSLILGKKSKQLQVLGHVLTLTVSL